MIWLGYVFVAARIDTLQGYKFHQFPWVPPKKLGSESTVLKPNKVYLAMMHDGSFKFVSRNA